MSVETELHEMRPALDRAIADARDALSIPRVAPPVHDGWSRSRLAIVAFAAVACVASVVGLVAQLGSNGRHGSTISTPLDSSTVPSTPPSNGPTSSAAATTTSLVVVPLQSVDWGSVTYPISQPCGTTFTPPVTVGHVEYAQPAPGVQLAIVEVACTHGAGTPPVAVYVYDHATSTTTPDLLQTLVRVSDGWQANQFSVDGATVDLPVFGFSSDSVPNCCPDVHASLDWSWNGSRYELTSTVPAHQPGPAFGGY